jgi:hypothetical protein
MLVRKLHNAGARRIDTSHWRSYDCKRLTTPLEKLVIDARHGHVSTLGTELERLLFNTIRPGARRRPAA